MRLNHFIKLVDENLTIPHYITEGNDVKIMDPIFDEGNDFFIFISDSECFLYSKIERYFNDPEFRTGPSERFNLSSNSCINITETEIIQHCKELEMNLKNIKMELKMENLEKDFIDKD